MRIGAVHDEDLGQGATQKTLRRTDFDLATPLELPRSETEQRLADIWQHVLGIDTTGIGDDFFELGGDSFAATALAAEIEATFSVRFAPSDIINSSTIAEQARAVVSAPQRLPPCLVVGRAGGSKPPLFIVHGGTGFSFFHSVFLDEVGHDRPIYLFQAPGLDGSTEPLDTLQAIADVYLGSMREIQPNGPYCIAGLCAGAFIALEMCNQLTAAGQSVARLILLDPKSGPRALLGRHPKAGSRALRIRFSTWSRQALRYLREAWLGVPDEFEEELRERARVLKRQEARRRGPHSEQLSYSPDIMLEAALHLNKALRLHVPRPFEGKAFLLVSSQRAPGTVGEGSFWRNHLGGIEYRVSNGHHRDIFGDNILDTARFVRSVLDAPS